MTLEEALLGISPSKYYRVCGMQNHSFYHYKTYAHSELTFRELPPQMKQGIIEMIWRVYRVQKMVYDYDLAYVTFCMKKCGIKLQWFFKTCELPSTFHRTLNGEYRKDERLLRIRHELIKMLIRLFDYALE